MKVPADTPITAAADDRIGRSERAESFAAHALSLDARDGLVIGVLGPWGAGKTSFLNLTRNALANSGVPVLEFNPWIFSGTEQLASAFFDEIATQVKLRKDLASLSQPLEAYGDALSGLDWLPVAGTFLKAGGGLAKLVGKRLSERQRGISGRRDDIQRALAKLTHPLVVTIDDVDRLTDEEIRDIFKLVRLTANFPNVIYLVAFDRVRVEQALSRDGFDGRAYLEKILQLSFDLPATPAVVIQNETLQAVDRALEQVADTGPFDAGRWQDVYVEIVRPLIKTMRDVRRYAIAVSAAAADLKGRVSLVDILALEALHVFLPDIFNALHVASDALTTPRDQGDRDSPQHKEIVLRLVQLAGAERESVVKAVIRRVFPFGEHHIGNMYYDIRSGREWLRAKRVAHRDVLTLYLERVAGESLLNFYESEKIRPLMSDASALNQFLRALPPERLEQAIASLEAFEDDFTEEEIVPSATVLLNVMYDIPERPRGMFELDARFVVTRIVYRLLRRFDGQENAMPHVRSILNGVDLLSAKLELISMCGAREGRGHRFIREDEATELEREWRSEVRETSSEALAAEPDAYWVVATAMSGARSAGEDELKIDFPPALTLSILRSASGESKSQSSSNREIKRALRLHWEGLVEVFGTEGTLQEKVTEAIEIAGTRDSDLVALLNKYLGGWRPKRFDDV